MSSTRLNISRSQMSVNSKTEKTGIEKRSLGIIPSSREVKISASEIQSDQRKKSNSPRFKTQSGQPDSGGTTSTITPSFNAIAKETQVQILAEFQEILTLFKNTDASLHVLQADKKRRNGDKGLSRQLVRTLESIMSSFDEFKKLNTTTSEFVIKRMVRANLKQYYQMLVDVVAPRYGLEAYEYLTAATLITNAKFDPLPYKCVPAVKVAPMSSTEGLLGIVEDNNSMQTLTLSDIVKERKMSGILDNAELKELLNKSVSTWGPDIFRVDEISNRKVLPLLAFTLFSERDFFSKFNIPEDTFFQYMLTAGSWYRADVRYHNHVHAADVMQSAHLLLSTVTGVLDFEVMALLFACAIHDIAHPGVNNPYMIAEEAPLAELYNNESVLENFHYDTGMKLLQQDGCDFLVNMPRAKRIAFKKLVKTLILATDMSNHINILSVFRQTLHRSKRVKPFKMMDGMLTDNQNVLCFLIHTADVSNPLKPLAIYKEWIRRLEFEFFKQGDRERERGKSISPMCDRTTVNFDASQSFFIDVVVKPLVDNLNLYASPNYCLKSLTDNMILNLDFFKMKSKRSSCASDSISGKKTTDSRRRSSNLILDNRFMSLGVKEEGSRGRKHSSWGMSSRYSKSTSPRNSPVNMKKSVFRSIIPPQYSSKAPQCDKQDVNKCKRMRSMLDSGHDFFTSFQLTRPNAHNRLKDALIISEIDAKENVKNNKGKITKGRVNLKH